MGIKLYYKIYLSILVTIILLIIFLVSPVNGDTRYTDFYPGYITENLQAVNHKLKYIEDMKQLCMLQQRKITNYYQANRIHYRRKDILNITCKVQENMSFSNINSTIQYYEDVLLLQNAIIRKFGLNDDNKK